MSDFLEAMAAASRARVPGVRPAAPDTPVEPFRAGRFAVIAEVKLRSPAVGALSGDVGGIAGRARTYLEAGASAVSVLTEPTRFDGDLAHLRAASVAGPCMRKDFLVHPDQIDEARASGASGVLLIAALLDDALLPAMLERAARAGLFVLLEAFDEADLRRCDVGWAGDQPLLVGVNCRDLRTLEVDPTRFERLASHLPSRRPAIAESGIEGPEDAARVARWGYRGVLVGTALMRSADPGGAIRQLIAAGERACG